MESVRNMGHVASSLGQLMRSCLDRFQPYIKMMRTFLEMLRRIKRTIHVRKAIGVVIAREKYGAMSMAHARSLLELMKMTNASRRRLPVDNER